MRETPILMPRIIHIEASDATINRQSYQDWLNPDNIGSDPYNIHAIITNRYKTKALDRDLLLARFYERLSYREIAERFGYSNKSGAWRAIHRAVKRLQKQIGEHRG